MIIENKKTSITYEITQSEWEKIKSLGKNRLFRVVDGEDRKPSIIQIPEKIIDFQKQLLDGGIKPSVTEPEKVEIPVEIQAKQQMQQIKTKSP